MSLFSGTESMTPFEGTKSLVVGPKPDSALRELHLSVLNGCDLSDSEHTRRVHLLGSLYARVITKDPRIDNEQGKPPFQAPPAPLHHLKIPSSPPVTNAPGEPC